MNLTLRIMASLVAVVMLAAGVRKLTRSREELIAAGNFDWATDFTSIQIRLIGVFGVLGAIGLVVPAWTGIAVILTPFAALGATAMMVGQRWCISTPRCGGDDGSAVRYRFPQRERVHDATAA